MPKLGSRPRPVAPSRALETAVAAPAAPPVPVAPPVREGRAHAPEDHMTFLNADGSKSRICICCCDDCWPPDAGKNPPPCTWTEDV